MFRSRNTRSFSTAIGSGFSRARNTRAAATGCSEDRTMACTGRAATRSTRSIGRRTVSDRTTISNSSISPSVSSNRSRRRMVCSSKSAALTTSQATWGNTTTSSGMRPVPLQASVCASRKSRSPISFLAITANGRPAATLCFWPAALMTRSRWRIRSWEIRRPLCCIIARLSFHSPPPRTARCAACRM